jgi:hypothetical protein
MTKYHPEKTFGDVVDKIKSKAHSVLTNEDVTKSAKQSIAL